MDTLLRPVRALWHAAARLWSLVRDDDHDDWIDSHRDAADERRHRLNLGMIIDGGGG